MRFNVIGSGILMSRHTTSGLDDLETLYPDLAKKWHMDYEYIAEEEAESISVRF